MGTFAFYIFYAIARIISFLPLPLLYVFADIVYLGLYYFPSYRKKVVRTNLRNSFPHKTEKELRLISKKYYHHLADLIFEVLKLGHISKEQLIRRMRLTNPELMDRLFNDNRDILAVLGHYNNWEWLQSIIFFTKHQTVSIYKPLQDKNYDRFILGLRGQKGMILTPMSGIIREIIRLRGENVRSMYAFITDQTPPVNDIKYWTTFLNQDTPVYMGLEKIAARYDMAVVWFSIKKIRRGYYTVTAELLFEHSTGMTEHQITDSHIRKLEEEIRERPEFWLWSHRRWKHRKKD
jgi:Kdo2-lipid IVA lauroyltransferase/acyltransferase